MDDSGAEHGRLVRFAPGDPAAFLADNGSWVTGRAIEQHVAPRTGRVFWTVEWKHDGEVHGAFRDEDDMSPTLGLLKPFAEW